MIKTVTSTKLPLFGLLIFLLSVDSVFALSGREIMEKNDALPEGQTSQGESVLVIQKGGNQEIKQFNAISKKYGKNTRSRISFTKPTKIEFLTWSVSGSDDLQWLKLSSGAVRKIASSDKDSSFVNSHFYYEDIGDRDIDDFNYEYLGDADVDGEATYKVQAIKKVGTKVYSKTIAYVRKSDYVIVRVEFFERGRHTKTLRNEKIAKIQGIYTPRKVVMEQYNNSGAVIGKSFLYVKSIKYNVAVSDAALKREAL